MQYTTSAHLRIHYIYYTAVSYICHTHAVAGKVLTMSLGGQDGEGDLLIDV